MAIHSSCSRVNNTAPLDFNEVPGNKAREGLHQNAGCFVEQIQIVALDQY